MTEKRLIDATALKTQVCNIPAHGESEQFYAIMGEIARAIERAETVDAVEVVRCRDCKHGKPVPDYVAKYFTDKAMSCAACRGDWSMMHGFSVVAVDSFCDEGERKEAHNGKVD